VFSRLKLPRKPPTGETALPLALPTRHTLTSRTVLAIDRPPANKLQRSSSAQQTPAHHAHFDAHVLGPMRG
jgi:hypothetical protein